MEPWRTLRGLSSRDRVDGMLNLSNLDDCDLLWHGRCKEGTELEAEPSPFPLALDAGGLADRNVSSCHRFIDDRRAFCRKLTVGFMYAGSLLLAIFISGTESFEKGGSWPEYDGLFCRNLSDFIV